MTNKLLIEQVKQALVKLRLNDMADNFDSAIEQAEKAQQGYLQFFAELLNKQVEGIRCRSLVRRLKKAELAAHMIVEILSLQTTTDGILRFRCPICGQYNSATKELTNLARCFICQENFNTIELVKHVKGFDFIRAVEYLRPYLPRDNAESKQHTQQSFQANINLMGDKQPIVKLSTKYIQENSYPGESWQEARQRLEKEVSRKLNSNLAVAP